MKQAAGLKGAQSLALTLLLVASSAMADTQQEQAVLASVQQFFDALATRDAVKATQVLLPEARAQSVRLKDGVQVIRNRAFQDDFASWPTRKERLLERMWNPQVKISGAIATVWTPYDFHIDGNFSHCGVDAFDLVQTPEGWKIVNVLYTVETVGCADSPLGKPASP